MQCKARKNQRENVQCPNKVKNGCEFCGKHIRIGPSNLFNNNPELANISENNNCGLKPIENDASENGCKVATFKDIEKTQNYSDFITLRRKYIGEVSKVITLVDYLENEKIESYPVARIMASLEHYNLIPKKVIGAAKFMTAMQYSSKLKKYMDLLLNATEHIEQIIKIQRFVRRTMARYYVKLQGPALYNRGICVNDIDFYSLDPIIEIPENQFYSFRDGIGIGSHIYGFHIDSIIQLIIKSDDNYAENIKKIADGMCYQQFIRTVINHYNKIKITNPYTRTLLSGDVKHNVITLMALNIYKKNGKTNINPIENPSEGITIDYKTQIRNRCFSIFQKIDKHGYFTDIRWLMDERPLVIKEFYKKLALIWNFDFGLSETAKYKIARCGNELFRHIGEIINFRGDKYHLIDKVLDVVNKLVDYGETESDKQSGCIIVLYGLASINRDCIRVNPWLA